MNNGYYDKKYFDWQKNVGKIGGRLNKNKFQEFINTDSSIIDFGSGGGFLLSELKAKEKIGIEINDEARSFAKTLGVESVKSIEDISDKWADVIISNHALEHVEQPLGIIKSLKSKLKPGGKIIFVTPFERDNAYQPNDINNHLYTWAPMNLGNLFNYAGYTVIEVKKLNQKWPPYYQRLVDTFGYKTVHFLSKVYGNIKRSQSQVRIVATVE